VRTTLADPERRKLDVLDEDAKDDPLTDDEAAAINAGQKCGPCKGYGLVRKRGEDKGKHYRTFNGAQQALGNGNAVDCPVCKGTGLVGLVA
jgi:hypothetical protein